MLAVLLFAFLQVSPDQDAAYQAGLVEVRGINDELLAITRHQSELIKSKAARTEEISSLRTRYPDIDVADGASVQDIYRALVVVRKARAAKLLPIANEKLKASDAELCARLADLNRARAELEASDSYKRTDLETRLKLRTELDNVIARVSSGSTCP